MDSDAIVSVRPDSGELDSARIRRRLREFASGARARPATSVAHAPGATRQDRHRQIIELRQAGWTYVAIGRVVGLSRQRVAQIDRAGGRSHTRGPRLIRSHEAAAVRSA
jgi:sigma-70-like protein